MIGVYTKDTLKVLNKTQLTDVSKNTGSDEFHYRLFDGRKERFELQF